MMHDCENPDCSRCHPDYDEPEVITDTDYPDDPDRNKEQQMKTQQSQVLQVLNAYTRGSFNLYWSLAGSHAAERAQIMTLIAGTKVPQAKAGITALTAAVHDLFGIEGTCHANREDNFVEFAKSATTR